jgi:hypothetical protein
MFERYPGGPQHFAALAAAIALVPVSPCGGGSGVVAGEQLAELIRLSRQLDARIAGHAHSYDRQGFAAADAATSTVAWLRAFTHMEAGQGRRIIASGQVAEALPLLGKAFADGDIGAEHVEAVAGGAAGMPVEVLAEHESTFAEFGSSLRPTELRRLAKRIRSLYDDEMVQRDAAHARESRSLYLSESSNGIWYLNGQLDAEAGAAIKSSLDALSRPLGPADDRTSPQRRADALYEQAMLALRSGELPDCGGDRPRLTLTVQPGALGAATLGDPPTELRRGLTGLAGALSGTGVGAAFAQSAVGAFNGGDAHLLGSSALLPAQLVERIGCDADVNVVVQDFDGEVLNYGRTRRFPSSPQRRGLVIRDGGCVFPGCDRPPRLCEAHHLCFWERDLGPTDMANLALVCAFHHHLVHEGQWVLERVERGVSGDLPGGGWRATAPDGRELLRERRRAA